VFDARYIIIPTTEAYYHVSLNDSPPMSAPTGEVSAGVAHLLQSSIPPALITFQSIQFESEETHFPFVFQL
jgi:hypothetical protein